MIYGYIRVSSDKQTVENQRFEINNFCEKQNLVINDWIEETISGTKNYTKRQLGLDGLQRHGPLRRLLHTGVDMGEGVALRGESVLHGAVVHGAQDAQVERTAVHAHAAAPEPCLVAFHQGGAHPVEGQVAAFGEGHETAKRRGVGLGGALAAHLPQVGYGAVQVVAQRGFLRAAAEGGDYLVGGVAAGLERGYHGLQPAHVPVGPLLHGGEIVLPFAADNHGLGTGVPFVGIQLIVGGDLAHHALLDNLVVEAAGLPLGR